MIELFREYIVVVWEGTEINNNTFRVSNSIIVRKSVKFYMKCWKYRNEMYHNREKQKQRITKQYLNEKEREENSEIIQ